MNFYKIEAVKKYRPLRIEVGPDFLIQEDEVDSDGQPNYDLMIRGGKFYAIWDPQKKIWSTNPKTVQRIVDADINAYIERRAKEDVERGIESPYNTKNGSLIRAYMRNNSSGSWGRFLKYVDSLPDAYHQLDEKLTFKDDITTKKDYASKRLNYNIAEGDISAYEELVTTLYAPEERAKFEWAIGSVFAGDSKKIQKFIVFHGPMGTGKSTIMNLIEKLFGGYKNGYCAKIDAQALVGGNVGFALTPFAKAPLVGIDQDSKLSRIEDNTILNQIVSHDTLQINQKFKDLFESSASCFLFMGTNEPVKITNSKSGVIRRLIDVEPTGNIISPENHYEDLVKQMDYELGAIAKHCLDVYKKMGRTYYSKYIPRRMMLRTDPFFNFMLDNYEFFKQHDCSGDNGAVNDYITGKMIWDMYQNWCNESGMDYKLKRFQVWDEAKSYFETFEERKKVKGTGDSYVSLRNVYSGLKDSKFKQQEIKAPVVIDECQKPEGPGITYPSWLEMKEQHSLLDDILADFPAQYGDDKPQLYWTDTEKIIDGKKVIIPGVKTKLKDLDTSKTHYVQMPKTMIQFDFDKKNEKGEKDFLLNAKAIGEMGLPPTYAELSKGGQGIHVAYWYDGNPEDLSLVVDENVELKVQIGNSALRRRAYKCNDLPIAHISSGLPLRRKKKVVNEYALKDAKHLHNRIMMALRKEVEPKATRTSMMYIRDELKRAQEAGIEYDFSNLDDIIYSFAANSSHSKDFCLKVYSELKLRWPEETVQEVPDVSRQIVNTKQLFDQPIVFFDIEVFKNCNIVVYKEQGKDKKCIRMINPKPYQLEPLFKMRLIGFNNRGYDNHIIWAIYLGYTPKQVYDLSQEIIVAGNRSPFRDAFNLSYTDVYDYCSTKQGLKKWEIDLGIHHQELGWPWDQDLPDELIDKAAEYCENDVIATEAVFDATQGDFKAREILAEIAGMTVNDTTNQLTTRIIFGDVKEPWHQFNYPDLKSKFPGYRFEFGKSYYRHDIKVPDPWDDNLAILTQKYGQQLKEVRPFDHIAIVDEIIGEGGRVYANPGMYRNVKTFDVASMHPSSIIAENGFGPFTQRFKELMDIRIAIKHKDFDSAKKMLDGKLAPYLNDPAQAKQLSFALKIAINSVYGLTAAKFQNKFKDPRNIDNWVAKRGALFMETLRLKVQNMGATVVHIKTDSIKIANPTSEVEAVILKYGKEWGYNFEVESIYDRICLVNDAVYIAKCSNDIENGDEAGHWTATGAQFQHPYVFKTLFSKEKINFVDLCETRSVKTDMYLDMNEAKPSVEAEEKDYDKLISRKKKLQKTLLDPNTSDDDKEKIQGELNDIPKELSVLDELIAVGHDYQFVGKTGSFCPIISGNGGGILLRKGTDGKYGAVAGTKGYRWLESEVVKERKYDRFIDMAYFKDLADVAIETINAYGNFDMFANGDHFENGLTSKTISHKNEDNPPWLTPCSSAEYEYCSDCPNYYGDQEYCCKLGYNVSNQIITD